MRDDFAPPAEAIAIIGMAGRFPGASNIEAFWQLLHAGVEGLSRLSRDDLQQAGIPPTLADHPSYVPVRGILSDADMFDAGFYAYSRAEAEVIDPQQRIFLECAWEALEHAGIDPNTNPAVISVFAGMGINTYMAQIGGSGDAAGNFAIAIANDKDFVATRVAYKLNLRGPAVTVQTACSTSLTAVHLACQNLLDYQSDVALAGGVTVIFPQEMGYLHQDGMILSPDGHCRAFDASAQGTVFGSGVGIVVLKRLSEALEDGDHIDAVILGSGMNNDGAVKLGYTAPAVQGQAEAIAMAQAVAGVSPETISYVETHGTATPLGDSVEIQALTRAFRHGTDQKQFCALGSVKTNIGHLDTAASAAGLIKTVLSLKHQQLPPSLHFTTPNPDIDFENSPFYVNHTLSDWPRNGTPRRAGVSGFGIGGTNVHVIVEEAPATDPLPPVEREAWLLPLSARSPQAVKDLARAYADFLRSDTAALSDICYSTAFRRTHHNHRYAIAGTSRAHLVERLDAFANSAEPVRKVVTGQPHKVVFVFPGQGAQWVGMGQQLLAHEAAFRAAIEKCDAALSEFVEWSLLDVLHGNAGEDILQRIDVIQPVLFSMAVGLVELWRTRGVEPDAVIGHSMGEVAASYVAGALSLRDAARVICRRSQLLLEVSGDKSDGAMMVVEMTLTEAQQLAAESGGRFAVAVSNSPISTVLSGDKTALAALAETLEENGTPHAWVKVDVASHSPHMDPLKESLLDALAAVAPQAGQLPIYSTASGKRTDGSAFDAAYWWQNLREPVLFDKMVRQLLSEGYNTFIEMSPHPILLHAVEDSMRHEQQVGLTLPAMRRQEHDLDIHLGSLGKLYAAGYPVAWDKLYDFKGQWVRLPRYPWQRERFWATSNQTTASTAQQTHGHPLLQRYLQSALDPATRYWETSLHATDDFYLYDTPAVPISLYLEMALAATAQALDTRTPGLHTVDIKQPLAVPAGTSRQVQWVASDDAGLQLFGLVPNGKTPSWQPLASAQSVIAEDEPGPKLAQIRHRCREQVTRDAFYEALSYGPTLQPIEQLWHGPNEILAQVGPVDAPGAYWLPPELLEACIQVVLPPGQPHVVSSLDSLQVFTRPGNGPWWIYAQLAPDGPRGDLWILTEDGSPVCMLQGLILRPLTEAEQVAFSNTNPTGRVIAPPKTALERDLAAIWAEVLGVREVSVRDNFFEMGGHSLLALRLLNRIRETVGTSISMSHLLLSPTIELLAQALESGVEAPPTVIPVQPHGSKPPFFCATPIMGLAFPYYTLAHHIGQEQPFFALQPRGLESGKPFKEIGALANFYIEAIQAQQPQGPYFLGGWSFGAHVAYEMARLLTQRQQNVALVALIDAPAQLPSQQPSFWEALKFFSISVMGNIWPYVHDYYALQMVGAKPNGKNNLRTLLGKAEIAHTISPELTRSAMRSSGLWPLFRVFWANFQATASYTPQPYPGPVTLLRTNAHPSHGFHNPTWGWNELAQGGVTVLNIPGEHMTLLREPHVQTVAQGLKACLEQAQTTHLP